MERTIRWEKVPHPIALRVPRRVLIKRLATKRLRIFARSVFAPIRANGMRIRANPPAYARYACSRRLRSHMLIRARYRRSWKTNVSHCSGRAGANLFRYIACVVPLRFQAAACDGRCSLDAHRNRWRHAPYPIRMRRACLASVGVLHRHHSFESHHSSAR